MVLVIDSGGTKLEWRLIGPESIDQGREDGYHPLVHPNEHLRQILMNLKESLGSQPISQVHFYGAGCSEYKHKEVIVEELKRVFSQATLEVESDMLAAARALCGDQPGIACILGTGSNSCVFDGNSIVEQIPPLGYILGDEGSGSYLGKQLLTNYSRNLLPKKIEEAFFKRYKLDKKEIPSALFGQDSPNRWLADFTRFLRHHKSDPFIYQIITAGFEVFFVEILSRYERSKVLPIHFSGSVAFYFNDFLRRIGAEKQFVIRNIVEGPIAGLALYHRNKAGL